MFCRMVFTAVHSHALDKHIVHGTQCEMLSLSIVDGRSTLQEGHEDNHVTERCK